jgi:hypothetical protein
MMTGKEKRTSCQMPTERSGTRDAVETAIDRAKSDKSSTWEGSASRTTKRISRWKTKEHSAELNDSKPPRP